MNKKKLMLVVVCPLLGLLALGGGGYQAWLMTPPPMPETVDDVEALLESRRYQRLSSAEQRPYREHMNEMWGELEREDRQRLGEVFETNPEAAQDAMEQGLRTMYTTMILERDEAGRNAMLDMMINRMETSEARQQRQQEQAQRNTEEGRERQEEGRRWMMQWMDQGDPQAMGYGSEFFKLLRERRAERGLPPF